jgi:signal transduction histidine kinase
MNQLKKIIINFFTCGLNDTADIEITRKLILLNICAIIAIVVITPLGFVSLSEQHYSFVFIDFLVVAFIGASILVLRITKKYTTVGYIVYFFLMALALYNFSTGGIEHSGFIWTYILPPAALFFFGLTEGTVYSLILVGAEILAIIIPNPFYAAHYTRAFLIRYSVSLLAVFITAFLFEYIRTQIQKKLQEKNEELTKTIQNLTETQKKLTTFAAKLEERNREQQEFIYIASHDLQEPLRKVSTFGDRLKAKFGKQIEAEGIDYLERMQSASHRMQTLINDLLTYSRISTKTHEYTVIDLNETLREVINDLELRIEQTHGHIEISNLPTLEADATQIRQLFQNLIGNALKFHKPEVAPVIQISANSIDEDNIQYYEITVSDNGIGIDQTNFERIFGVFQRLHGKEEYEGTGVGLAICKKIVERHGGKIKVQSKLNEGSRFIVTLPVKPVNP